MRKLITFFVKYPIWANVVIIVVVGLGVVSSGFKTPKIAIGDLVIFESVQLPGLKKSFFPELESRIITVQVIQPGASPEEMEEGVTIKVEESLKGLEGIEEVKSTSSENSALINVEGIKGYDPNLLLTDVKNAVDKISSFPADAEKPIVFLTKRPDRTIALILEGEVPLKTLKEEAEDIEDRFLATGFISQIDLTGFPDLEISVDMKEEDLLRYNLTFDEVSRAISLNNRDISGGTIRSAEEEILIRANAKEYEAAEIGNIILRTNTDGSIVRVRDVAQLEERFSEVPNKNLFNGRNAVGINVEKLVEEDILKITDHVKEFVEEFNQSHTDMQIFVMQDQSVFLKQRLNLLMKNGGIGLVLVVITLTIFLSVRLSFWVAFSIPFCFLGMFFIAYLAGITINMISLFGMILVIGILVDDGIVIGENIYSHYERGKSRVQAAIDGTVEVIGPVFASVTTTILAFCIIFFLEGRLGEFIVQMAIVVIATLFFSLVEALIILPSHLAYSKGLTRESNNPVRKRVESILDYIRNVLYAKLLRLCIEYKFITLAFVIFFVMTISGLVSGGIISATFFPPIERDDATVSIVMPPGTREDITEGILLDIQDKVWKVNQSLSAGREDSLEVIVATQIEIGKAGTETGSHTGTLNIKLQEGGARNLSSFVITDSIRRRIGIIPEADKLTVGTRQIFGMPVSVSLSSYKLDELEGAKTMLKDRLAEFDALRDITDNDVAGKREVKLEMKPQAYLLGLNHGEIARQVRQGFFGEEVQRLQKGTDEVKVWVRYGEEDRASLGKLEQMKIKTPLGQEYPLGQLVDYTIERGLVAINHLNGAREITVDADIKDPSIPVPEILTKVEEDIMPEILAAYPNTRYEFKGQQEEGTKMQRSLLGTPDKVGALPVAAVLILILIALVFRSFVQSAMILSLLPIGVFCAILGHGIEAIPVSTLSMYGIIALSGIIINDAVVLLDKFNNLLREGLKVKEAAYQAGIHRFRAIMLTSITTVLGLYPLILEQSLQAQFLVPMAVAVAYGVLFGTIFILTYFPAFIMLVNDARRFLFWVWVGRWPSREEVEPAVVEVKRLKRNMAGIDEEVAVASGTEKEEDEE